MAFKLSSLFKRSNKDEKKEEAVKEEPVPKTEEVKVSPELEVRKEVRKAGTKPAPAKRSAVKPAAKAAAKKTAAKKTPAKTSSKTVSKKPADDAIKMPPELKGFEKKLKDYAVHIRTEYNSKNANYIFTEYMAMIFRDIGHKMVLIRDQDAGLITMLGKENGDSVKSKIVVLCRFAKKGNVDVSAVTEAQELGERNRADEVWCITTTEFSEEAVRKSKKKGAKVKLFDGRKLCKDILSKTE